ncbi:MAG: EamA family transporter, partial [Thermoanaerobaculia bacterium]
LSLAVPLLSLTPVFATLFAIPLLGEQPSPSDFLGILLVVAGAVFLGGEIGAQAGGGRSPRVALSKRWQALSQSPPIRRAAKRRRAPPSRRLPSARRYPGGPPPPAFPRPRASRKLPIIAC